MAKGVNSGSVHGMSNVAIEVFFLIGEHHRSNFDSKSVDVAMLPHFNVGFAQNLFHPLCVCSGATEGQSEVTNLFFGELKDISCHDFHAGFHRWRVFGQ